MLLGPKETAAGALADLATGRMQSDNPWPDAYAEAEWERLGRKVLHLGRVSRHTLVSAWQLGFVNLDGQPQPYYQAHAWYIHGRPRFAERVRHRCRVVSGSELLPLFTADNDDPKDRDYLRDCLQAGPSFVCEANGQAVSWSLTNLGGAIARIFTPEEYRGRGYASSLIALQFDTLLERQGLAAASVRIDNVGSYRIFEGLGARHIRGPLNWSNLLWPGG